MLRKIKLPLDIEDDFVCGARIDAIKALENKKVVIYDWHFKELLCLIKGNSDHTSYDVKLLNNNLRLSLAYHDLYELYVFDD